MPMPGVSAESFQQIAERIGVPLQHVWDLSTYEDEVRTTLTINQIMRLSVFTGVRPEVLIGVAPSQPTDAQKIPPAEFCDFLRRYINAADSSVADFETKAGWEIARILDDPTMLYELANWDCLRDVAQAIGVDPFRVLPQGNQGSEQGADDQAAAAVD